MRIRASSSPSESSRSGSFGIGASIGVSRCVQLLQTSPIPPPNLHDVPSPIASSSTGLKGDLRSNPRTRPSVVRVSPATTDERACSVWTRTARSPHRTTNPARDRASKTCSAVLCAGQQPEVTWVGLSLKGSPLASASVRLTPGPRNGAHFRAAAAVAAAPAATIAASAASDRLRRTAASPPPPPLPLTPPPPQPPPSLLCPPDRRRCRQCRLCQLHARARAAASPRARVRALASSRALSAPHSTAQHSASSMRELACELHFCKRELCAPCSKDR